MGLLFVLEARASEEPALERITSGTLLVQDETGHYHDSAVLNTSISMTISGMVARVTVEQAFANTGTDWLEGLYVFPLPESAAVNAMTIQIGDRIIQGSVAEKVAAQRQYQQARIEGRVASLVSQQRPNLFTTKIANIAPGNTVGVTLHYVQTVSYRNDEFGLRLPMTITPRYSNASVSDSRAISPPQFFPGEQVTPTALLDATLYLPGAINTVHSPSHELVLHEKPQDQSVSISFAGTQLMDRDLVLNWKPALQAQPTLSSWIESVGGDDYLLTMLLPPQHINDFARAKRELILVMDTSGSMAGESIRAAKLALHSALDGLQDSDRFNLVEFNSHASKTFSASVPATAANLDRARRAIAVMQADGGTEIQSALQLALANPVDGFLRQVVFVTDGSVGNEDHLFGYIEQHLRRARLFTVGIGSAPNSYFMHKAAEAGRGTYTYIGTIAEAATKMSELFLALENPALTDIDIRWQGDAAEHTPSPIADLYLGEPLVISARLGDSTTGFTVSGQFGNQAAGNSDDDMTGNTSTGSRWEHNVSLAAAPRVSSGLSTIWARRKIDALLDQQRRSPDPDQYRQQITHIALEHQMVTRYTSLLATDSNPVRPANAPSRTSELALAMPAGAAASLVSMPRGAAGTDSLLLLATVSSLLALLCYRLQRRQHRRFGVRARV